MVEEVPASLEGIIEVVLGVPTTKPEVGVLPKGMNMDPPTLMDIEVVEMTLVAAPLALPIIMETRCRWPNYQCLHYRRSMLTLRWLEKRSLS